MILFVLNELILLIAFLLFDIDLRDTTVFHTLEFAVGGSATETVATRGDAVVIEEV